MLKKTLYIVISSIIVLVIYQYKFDFNKGVELSVSNDEWEHQSMAVNFAEGFGLHKLGGYTNFEAYDYTYYDGSFPFLYKLHSDFPSQYYHRNIGFSLVAGTIYKVFGNDSIYLRIFNFLLLLTSWLVCVATLQNIIGKRQLTIGLLILTPLFLIACFDYIKVIGDDIFIIFFISLLFYMVNRWYNQPSFLNAIFLGLTITTSLLFKSTLIFYSLFLIFFIQRDSNKFKFIGQLGVVFLFITLFVMVYSNYINKSYNDYKGYDSNFLKSELLAVEWTKEDSLLIEKYHLKNLSKNNVELESYKILAHYLFERQFYNPRKFTLTGQGTYLFLDGNNEFCAQGNYKTVGSWSPLWHFSANSFYYDYDFKIHPLIKVASFYYHKPQYILPILVNKLNAGFRTNYLFLLLAVFQTLLIILAFNNVKYNYLLISLLAMFTFLYIWLKLNGAIAVVVFLISSIILLRQYLNQLNFKEIQIIKVVYSFVLYYIFLTVILFGLPRYTMTGNAMYLTLIAFWVYIYFDKTIAKA